MKDKQENHIIWLDLLRVISIFCMMLLHVCASQFDAVDVNSFEWQVLNVYDSLVRFCVPVFVMISGVFFLDPKKEYPLKKLLKKNIWRIVTAYLFWSVCYAVVISFIDYRTINRAYFENVARETITGRYHLWFLNMIVGIYLVVPILRKISQDKKLTEYFILLSFFGCYVGNLLKILPVVGEIIGTVQDKSSFYLVAGYTGYFMAGYYFYTYDISGKWKKAIYALGGASLLLTGIGTSVLSLQTGKADARLYDYLFPTICCVAWAVFLFFKERVSYIRFSEKSGHSIVSLAGLSFGMYLVHDFVNCVLKFAGITPVSFNTILAVPLLAGVVFAVSFAVIWVMSKIPFARKYLM